MWVYTSPLLVVRDFAWVAILLASEAFLFEDACKQKGVGFRLTAGFDFGFGWQNPSTAPKHQELLVSAAACRQPQTLNPKP